MATLQNIRNKSGLLLAVIGIAMLAFILGDLLKSTNSGGSNGIYVGEVLGNDILIQTFQEKVDDGIRNWKNQNQQTAISQATISQIREQIWNQYVRELIMINEFEKLGIDVSDDEFFELLQGVNVHPEISKVPSFQDPVSGKFDRTKVIAYLQQIDQDPSGDALNRWIGFQKYLIGLIKTSKYHALVSNSIFTTDEEARLESSSINSKALFNYVFIPYSSIDNSDAQPTEDEIEEYYSIHKNEYTQMSSKDVDFVAFSAVPSLEDDAATKAQISELVADFGVFDDYELMVRRNSDFSNQIFSYLTKDKLQDPKWNDLFDAKKGTVIGPYLTRPGVYRIAKLAEVEFRPDSVKARHILIKPTPNISLDSVNKKVAALKIAIEQGADFGVIANKNSEDQGSAIKNGDLGWFEEGVMVKEFNESCFSSKVGDLSIVESQFGVHLIEVTKKSKLVKKSLIVFIDRNIEPSTETYNTYYSKAAKFAGSILNDGIHFDTLIESENLVKRSDKNVKDNKQAITGLPNSREMVRWMNGAEVGSVSEVFQFDNSYVVAYLTKEYTEGPPKLEEVKEQISAIVLKENKALKILEAINDTDLVSIANANSANVDSNYTAVFSNLSIDGIGYEPELVGSIFANNNGSLSSPIKGRNGVYFIEVISIKNPVSSGDFTTLKSRLESEARSSSKSNSYKVLEKVANVFDNRVDFY